MSIMIAEVTVADLQAFPIVGIATAIRGIISSPNSGPSVMRRRRTFCTASSEIIRTT